MKFSISTKLKFYKYYRYVDKSNEFLTALMILGIKHPIFGILGLTSNILKLIFKNININTIDIMDDWHSSKYSFKVTNFLNEKLLNYLIFSNKDEGIALYKIDNYHALNFEGILYFENKEAEKYIIKKSFSSEKNIKLLPKDRNFDLVPINDKIIFESQRAKNLYDRLNFSFQKKRFRSLLLYGPPGTGKTCMAQFIANSFSNEYNGTILHINLKDFEDFTPSDLQMFLEFIKSEIVILDDIDCFNDIDALLKLFETNKDRHKLIIATSNNMISLAARRPERFDEVKLIDRLPLELLENSFRELNSLLNESQREELLSWPISYVNELNIRREDFKDHFQLNNEMEDLKNRLEIEEIPKILKSKKQFAEDI